MSELTARRNVPMDLVPLARLLDSEEAIALVNPNAKHPFDPLEWQSNWLGDLEDESFYLLDAKGREVGFFALRVGVGPEVRHLTYVYLEPEQRGGSGARVTELIERAARDLGALSITLKVELDNPAALNAYLSAGYEELSQRGGMATMRRDLDGLSPGPGPATLSGSAFLRE